MNYQSIADLAETIRANLHRVPMDVDLVVGVPRSGMLPASMLALNLNVKFCELNGLLSNAELRHGRTREIRHGALRFPNDAKHIFVLDDSIDSGGSMAEVRRAIEALNLPAKITYAAAYATANGSSQVDLHFLTLNQPRAFEWNLMHRSLLADCCVDIDGVLCWDPTSAENDDGPRYAQFLKTARPLVLPSHQIGHLVSSRLEKYRVETEAWLEQHGVRYGRLHLLDLPDAVTRRKLGSHGKFKAQTYRQLRGTRLFIESEQAQAQEIAQLSGKPALCFSNQTMYVPGMSYALARQLQHSFSLRIQRKLTRLATKLLGNG